MKKGFGGLYNGTPEWSNGFLKRVRIAKKERGENMSTTTIEKLLTFSRKKKTLLDEMRYWIDPNDKVEVEKRIREISLLQGEERNMWLDFISDYKLHEELGTVWTEGHSWTNHIPWKRGEDSSEEGGNSV